MNESQDIFQILSLRRKVIISIGMLTVLIIVIGLYGLIAVAESNKRLHQGLIQGQTMAGAVDAARLSQVHFKKQVQEWKNLLLRGQDKSLYDVHYKAFIDEERKTDGYLKSLSQIITTENISIPPIADALTAHEKMGKTYREALAKHSPLNAGNAAFIDRSVRGIDRKLIDDIDAIVEIVKKNAGQKMQETEQLAKIKAESYYALSVCIFFLMMAAVGFAFFNILSITRDLPSNNCNKDTSVDKTKQDS